MKFTLELSLDDDAAAADRAEAVRAALSRVAYQVQDESYPAQGTILDINGNVIGHWLIVMEYVGLPGPLQCPECGSGFVRTTMLKTPIPVGDCCTPVIVELPWRECERCHCEWRDMESEAIVDAATLHRRVQT